jgi:MinD superfamily P-loop ATPase
MCTGCGICFYCCPEPGAITVYRMKAKATEAKEAKHAPTL